MAKSGEKLRDGLREIDKVSGRAGNDTIKLWEGYKEQAILWRALALLQMPTTFIAVCTALVMFFFKDTVIEVPPVPQPGHYSVKELPDAAFINVANEIVNLIATYQPEKAPMQFRAVRQFLWEPALSAMQEFANEELPNIAQLRRSQVFFPIRGLTTVQRNQADDTITVRIVGKRHKFIGEGLVGVGNQVYTVILFTVPRNVTNQYGIVAKGVIVESPDSIQS